MRVKGRVIAGAGSVALVFSGLSLGSCSAHTNVQASTQSGYQSTTQNSISSSSHSMNWNGNTGVHMAGNSVSSSSSSAQHSDGTRDTKSQVSVGGEGWMLEMIAVSTVRPGDPTPSRTMTMVVTDDEGRHTLTAGHDFQSKSGAFFQPKDTSLHIVQKTADGSEHVTDVVAEDHGSAGIKLNVRQR